MTTSSTDQKLDTLIELLTHQMTIQQQPSTYPEYRQRRERPRTERRDATDPSPNKVGTLLFLAKKKGIIVKYVMRQDTMNKIALLFQK